MCIAWLGRDLFRRKNIEQTNSIQIHFERKNHEEKSKHNDYPNGHRRMLNADTVWMR
jgi:hypothetical protein